MSREEAIELCQKYDGEFPGYYLDDILEYLDLTKQDFLDVVNKHRNNEIWKKDSNDNWELRFPLPKIAS